MHRMKKKLEPKAADTEPISITNLRREGKALQIETIDQDSEFTESESLFDYEKKQINRIFDVKLFFLAMVAVTFLGDAPNLDLTFNVVKPHNIARKPKSSKDYLLEITFQDLNIVLDL